MPFCDFVLDDRIELLPLMIVSISAGMKNHLILVFLTAHREIDERDLHRDRTVEAVQQLRELSELDFLLILCQCSVVDIRNQITFAVKVDCLMPDLHILCIQHYMIGYEAFIGHRLNRCAFVFSSGLLLSGLFLFQSASSCSFKKRSINILPTDTAYSSGFHQFFIFNWYYKDTE